MFVIADNTKKTPNYFWKMAGSNLPLITVSLKDAHIFKDLKSAKLTLSEIIQDKTFRFQIHEIGITKQITF